MAQDSVDRLPRCSPFWPPLPAQPGERRIWRRLHGSSRPLAIAAAAQTHAGVTVVVAADNLAADRLRDELGFFLGSACELPVIVFPDWETLPYDQFSPYRDIVSDRLAALSRLPALVAGIVVVPVTTLMHRLCPRQYVEARTFAIGHGSRFDRDEFRRRLEAAGYRAAAQVVEHGEFAVRGSLIDLYPMGSDVPYRIDLLDDEVDSIRIFDPESQCSTGAVDAIRMLPAHEFPLGEEAIARFRSQWRSRFEGNPTNSPLYNDVSQGFCPGGIEYYLPLFFDGTATLFDYLPSGSLFIVQERVAAAADAFRREVEERHEQGRHDAQRPLLAPAELFLDPNEVFAGIRRYPSIAIRGDDEEGAVGVCEFATLPPPPVPVDARAAEPFARFRAFRDGFEGRVLVVAESAGRRETLLELFKGGDLTPVQCPDWQTFVTGAASLALTVAPLQEGAWIEQPALAIVAETQLFGERAAQRRQRRAATRDPESVIRDLAELKIGAPVVHEDHGVGRYQGLVALVIDGLTGEYLLLVYADGDRLYVPVASLHLISRYSGIDPDHAPLHKLGSGQWGRARARAAARIRDVAAELLDVYARRAARHGHRFRVESSAYAAFVQRFPFEETPDQANTIDQVLADMQSERPMDRLVCGDVGFGKTEVAMRAAFVAAHDGRQVALLVPTTLLAQQHHQNFRDRFADWPVRIELLSRFRSKKEQDDVIRDLAEGRIDILIGTHKLLASAIRFKRLGLLIIDEEHRFGVRQKERLKSLRAEVDVLTLTATPIPRTLNMALSSVRELSIIATPPSRRLAVKTFVREWENGLLREALLREIGRGGQVYFLHNDVESIDKTAALVADLVPEARVRVAHGQMRERDLERVMLDFYHRRFNVLVCTTIIETGIDIPTANTIVINRADKFGLAQLYQLRGRVGLSHHRAYAYLIVPPRSAISADAVKRLEAIEALEELGMGFTLATHDLEIRGAGEILGDEQSGHIQEIGYGLYTELLERAVASLKAGREPDIERPLSHGPEIDLQLPARLPEDYVPDVHARLILYKRIASCRNDEELIALREELIDRFGGLPEPARNLFAVTAIKIEAVPLGVRKVELGDGGGRILFVDQPAVDPQAIIRLIQTLPKAYRLDGGDKLRIIKEMPDGEARLHELRALFQQFRVRQPAAPGGTGRP